jgi:spermidine/putrescine transport system substrate-binding protein
VAQRQRSPYNVRPFTRRQFLRSSAGGLLSLPAAAALLAACGSSDDQQAAQQAAELIGRASPDQPRTLPIFEDNPPIADGLGPEAGPLKVYNWVDYTYKKVIKKFEEEYGVEVEVSNFSSSGEALSKIRSGSIDFDVYFPATDQVGKLVAAKRLQPLNLSYIPNLSGAVWPELASPYYDVGPRYTVPYMTWKTGIGYRSDMVDDPESYPNPYDVLWDARYEGKVGVYDEYRDTMGLTLLRNGHEDINTSDPALIEETKQSLQEMDETVNVRVSSANDDYVTVAEGITSVHTSWSGNMVYAQYYLPKGTESDVLGFWFPEDGRGIVANDMIGVSATAKNPVLAHHYLNFLLDYDNAFLNMSYEGYQPPLIDIDLDRVLEAGFIPENLGSTVVRREDFQSGYYQVELEPEVEQLWQDAWSDFKSGA